MQYTFGSKGRSRLFAALLVGVVVFACVVFILQSLDRSHFKDPGSKDLSGEWEFQNGTQPDGSLIFPEKVEVPKPLPDRIRSELKEVFWYRKSFSMPESMRGREVALSLGSIKGAHEVYWNEKFLGSGGATGLGLYRVPPHFSQEESISLVVKIKKSASLFPGIVHMNPISLGENVDLDKQLNQYFFDTGVKPLLPTLFKLALFFLFIGFFAAVPYKREYLSFSLFALFSSLSSAFYSRFLPGYENNAFKNAMIFLFFSLAMSVVPPLAADFLRLPERYRSAARIFGACLGLVFISAALLVSMHEHQLAVYRLANQYLPALALLPAVFACLWFAWKLERSLVHRKIQMMTFSIFLLAGFFSWGSSSTAFLKFKLFQVYEFLDLFVFVGLGTAIALDFRQTAARSMKASLVVPKWFSSFLSNGLDRVTLELPLIAMAVDTVGYTKHLSSLSSDSKDEFHAAIRNALAILTERLQGQKISERGDGGIFAWDLPDGQREREAALRLVLEASRGLAAVAKQEKIQFRVGIACGIVRGEMRGGDISFLGDALNCAARLESMAEPGTALVDESLVSILSHGQLEAEWIEAELKGVVYRARPLRLVS